MDKPKSKFEILPLECIQAILGFIDNVPNLESINRSCKAIHKALDQLLLEQVLTNEIGLEVLPEALLTTLVSRNVPFTKDDLGEFGNRFLKGGRNFDLKAHANLRLRDALFLSKLHSQVTWFTNDFISKAFASRCFTNGASMMTSQLPASDREIWRIQRAFYRFQIYCCMVNRGESPPRSSPSYIDFEAVDQNGIFFSHFSVLENEQLACIHDYIFRILAPGFNSLVDHDIGWINFLPEYASFEDPRTLEPLIARGLFKVRDMVDAKSYEQLHKSCYPDYPHYSSDLLDYGLKNSAKGFGEDHDGEDYDYWLEDYTDKDNDKLIKESTWLYDQDKGPELVWRWAHATFSSRFFVLSEQHRFEREWGYVMWDYSRISELGVMENEWESNSEYEFSHMYRPSQESIDRRLLIYSRGGRGWWSAEDESKVIWPGGCSPFDQISVEDRRDPDKVSSINEAKDFMRSLELPQLPSSSQRRRHNNH